jgi:hypothetical protein
VYTHPKEGIIDPKFWRERLHQAKLLHHAIYQCPIDVWVAIENHHRKILEKLIGPNDSILDAGCAWGRLLTLLPQKWQGEYIGLDISPDFIELAKRHHPSRTFVEADFRNLSWVQDKYDWAILISIRPMILRNLGEQVWEKIHCELCSVCKKVLYLEYDLETQGEVEYKIEECP